MRRVGPQKQSLDVPPNARLLRSVSYKREEDSSSQSGTKAVVVGFKGREKEDFKLKTFSLNVSFLSSLDSHLHSQLPILLLLLLLAAYDRLRILMSVSMDRGNSTNGEGQRKGGLVFQPSTLSPLSQNFRRFQKIHIFLEHERLATIDFISCIQGREQP